MSFESFIEELRAKRFPDAEEVGAAWEGPVGAADRGSATKTPVVWHSKMFTNRWFLFTKMFFRLFWAYWIHPFGLKLLVLGEFLS